MSGRFRILSIGLVAAAILAACGAPAAAPPAAPTAAPAAPKPTEAAKPAAPVATAAPAAAKPKLTIWLAKSFTPEADAAQKDIVTKWAAAKNVDLTVVQDLSTVLAPQFNAAIETKTLPDVMVWASSDWMPKLHSLGLLEDVSDVIAKMNAQGGGLLEKPVKAVTIGGKQWAVPTYGATEVFYVRKDIFDAAGLQPPKTWADIMTVSEKINNPGKTWAWGVQFGTPSYDSEIATLSFLASYGASPYAEDGKTPNLNNDGTRTVLKMLKDAYDKGYIPKDAVTWDDAGNNKAYLTGSAAIVQNTGSIIAAMRKDDPDLLKRTYIVPMPEGPKGRVMVQYVYGMMIPKGGKNLELAKDLLSDLVSVGSQKRIVEAAGTNYMPFYKDLQKLPMWDDPFNKTLISQLPDVVAVGHPGPTTLWALESWRTHSMAEMVTKVLVEKVSIDDAIKETEAKMTKIYKQFNP
ncbi:MAG: extracellular solute-binding protein [Anaerolineae bacterium]|nr:extracellular solute-binding protein [Anaerolineae bacterium]